MIPDELEDRLSHISTLWTVVLQAHGTADGAALSAAHKMLMDRYSGAVYRYLLGAVRDAEAATDLFQEFALRLLRGDFKRAAPARGRFRNYLRTAIINLVNDYYDEQRRQPHRLAAGGLEPAAPTNQGMHSADSERDFIASWRAELLDRTWKALAAAQPVYHAVLNSRIENPDLSSAEMGQKLAAQLGKPMPAATVRKSLQRAHAKFADLLLQEVACSIENSAVDAVEKELRDLNLTKYCQEALERRRGKP